MPEGVRPSVSAGRVAAPQPSLLLEALKRHGALSIRDLALELAVTYEAVRQQIGELTRAGWIVAEPGPAQGRRGPAGRRYRLTAAAEHLFPKHYDALSEELIREILETFGGAALTGILKRMTAARVRRFKPLLKRKSLEEKLRVLCGLYGDKDAYMDVERWQGAPALVERNCPFFNVAQKHPAICSVSVNTLEQLLGCKVVRVQRFQRGHGRCVFRLWPDEPARPSTTFALEP